MPKKPPRNSFYYFMLEFKTREEQKGITFTGMPEVAKAADPEWKHMTPTEKRPYEQQANRNKQSGKAVVKYTSLGEDVELVTKRIQAVADAKKNMETYIERLVANGLEYESKEFLVASVNHYCFCTSQAYYRHIPAELSVVRFSLRTGVHMDDIYHAIYDPGRVPMGYTLAAKMTSEESHEIPLPPHEGPIAEISEKTTRQTFDHLLNFLMTNSNNVIPPLYVDMKEMDMAKDIFKHFLIDNGYDENAIKVYSLPYLFFILRNAARVRLGQDPAFPYASIAETEFDRDIYDYYRGISCKYHSITEAYPHCTMSKAVRKIYIMCDHCCGDLNIPLVPGVHVPKTAIVHKLTKASATVTSATATVTSAAVTASLSADPPLHLIKRPSLTVSYSDHMKALKIAPAKVDVDDTAPVLEDDVATGSDKPGPSKLRRPFSSSCAIRENIPAVVQPATRGRGRGRIL